jgi:hypothetical protein
MLHVLAIVQLLMVDVAAAGLRKRRQLEALDLAFVPTLSNILILTSKELFEAARRALEMLVSMACFACLINCGLMQRPAWNCTHKP